MDLRRLRLHVIPLVAVLVLAGSGCRITPRATGPAAAGDVHFLKGMNSSDDALFEGAGNRDWIRTHFDSAIVHRPYFDRHLSWYRGGLVYKDAYAIYPGEGHDRAHPEWILRDAQGRKLYIPWACAGGTCPQYAADIGDRAWRAQWIAEARADLARGYRGLWIDDVNLEFRVGNGSGAFVAPWDERTRRPMTYADWRRYMAEFMEQIRRELPRAVLVHNSLWFGGHSVGRWRDPYVRRQIKAADWIHIERGAVDAGVTGGGGDWSLHKLLEFVDVVHFNRKWVVWGQTTEPDPVAYEYNLATYFLTSAGFDAVGAPNQTRSSWWPGFDVRLGAPRGGRRLSAGVLRRDFERGVVLVNEPGAPTRTVSLGRPMRTVGGRTVGSVTLGARRGAVLRYP